MPSTAMRVAPASRPLSTSASRQRSTRAKRAALRPTASGLASISMLIGCFPLAT